MKLVLVIVNTSQKQVFVLVLFVGKQEYLALKTGFPHNYVLQIQNFCIVPRMTPTLMSWNSISFSNNNLPNF